MFKRLIFAAVLALVLAAPVVAQPADQQNVVVALLVDPRPPHDLFTPQVASGDCATVMGLQHGLMDLCMTLYRIGAVAYCSTFVVAPGWTLGQQIDINRCTPKQKVQP